jgi:hypothetical protein
MADKTKHVNSLDKTMRWAFGGSNSYVVLAEGEALAQNKNHLSLYNAVAAAGGRAEIVQVHDIRIINLAVGAVVGAACRFNVSRFTTAHTGGTTLTPVALDSNSPTLDPSITALRAGTVTPTELLYPIVIGTDEVTDASGAQTGGDLYFPYGFGIEPFRLNPGEGLVLDQITNITAGALGFIFAFSVAADL